MFEIKIDGIKEVVDTLNHLQKNVEELEEKQCIAKIEDGNKYIILKTDFEGNLNSLSREALRGEERGRRLFLQESSVMGCLKSFAPNITPTPIWHAAHLLFPTFSDRTESLMTHFLPSFCFHPLAADNGVLQKLLNDMLCDPSQ